MSDLEKHLRRRFVEQTYRVCDIFDELGIDEILPHHLNIPCVVEAYAELNIIIDELSAIGVDIEAEMTVFFDEESYSNNN